MEKELLFNDKLLDEAGVVFLIIDQDQIIHYVSEHIGRLGFAVEKVRGKNIFELVSPEDQITLKDQLVKFYLSSDGLFLPFSISFSDNQKQDRHFLLSLKKINDLAVNEGILLTLQYLPHSAKNTVLLNQKNEPKEDLVEKIIENVSIPIIFSRVSDKKIIFINQAALKLFGYEKEEVMGRKTLNAWSSLNDREEIIRNLFESVKSVTSEYLLKSKNNEKFWGLVTAQVIEYNKEKAIIASVIDINERKLAEEKVKESEAHLKALLNSGKLGIWAVDRDLKIIFFNEHHRKKVKEFFDVAIEKGIEVGDLVKNLPNAGELREIYMNALNGESYFFQAEVENYDGSTHWAEFQFSPIWIANKIEGVMVIAREITEQKLNQMQLQQSERKYKALMNQASDAIFLANPETGMLIDANEKALQLLNYTLDEIRAMHHSEVHPKELRDIYTDFFKRKIGGVDFQENQTIKLESKDGTIIPCDARATLVDADGKKILMGIFRDIREKINSEKALKKLKDFYESILNFIQVEIAIYDENLRYIYLNPQALKDESNPNEMSEWLIGKSLYDYCNCTGVDKSVAKERENQLKEVIRTKSDLHWEELQIDRKGREKIALRTLKPIFDNGGKLIMVISTSEEITHIKKQEEEINKISIGLKNALSIAKLGYWEFDVPSQKNIYFSSETFKHYGISYDSPLPTYNEFINILHSEDKEKSVKEFRELITFKKPYAIETRVIHPDGSTRWLLLNAEAIVDKKGWVVRTIGTSLDITEQKLIEQQLQNALSELKERNYELDNFVYKVSHDLRAPLASIIGLIDLIKEEKKPEMIQKYVHLIENRAHKLDEFIKTILMYSRSLNEDLQIQNVDFLKIIQNCFDELKYIPNAEKIKLKIEIKGEGFVNDQFRISTILKNFMSNAIKYLNPYAEENFIECIVDIDEKKAEIIISDNGIGIDEEHLPKIFNMFFRATEKSEGSGLGLYIVKQNVDKLNGKLEVHSEAGKGTEIKLILPNQFHTYQDHLKNEEI